MVVGLLLPLVTADSSETLARLEGHGGSPRILPRRRRVDGVKQISTATSVMGGNFRFGSGKWLAREAEKVCPGAHQGLRSNEPRSKIRAGLGWYYRGKYTPAEREVGDGPDRRHFVLLPCRFEGRVSLLLLSYRVWGCSGCSGKTR
jgi:hypothetical protein